MMRLDAYLLLISCDNDLVTSVLDLISRSFPSLNVDVIDTLGAGLKELRSNAYDLCVLDFSDAALHLPSALCAISPSNSTTGSIAILADELCGRVACGDAVDCIPRSRADAWTLGRSISHALERRTLTATIERLRRYPRRNDASPAPRPLALAAPEGIPLLFEHTEASDLPMHAHGIATADGAGTSCRDAVTAGDDATGSRVDGGLTPAADADTIRSATERQESDTPYRTGSIRKQRANIPSGAPEGAGGGAGSSIGAVETPIHGALLGAIMDVSPSLIAVIDQVGCIVTINRAVETTTGYAAGELLGAPAWHLAVEEERGIVLQHVEALLAGHTPGIIETRVASKSGGHRLVAWSATTVRDRNGNVTHIVACGTDLTDQRAAERLLLQSEERFRVLIEQGQDDVTIADADGMVTYANPSAAHVTGYTPDEVIGTSVFDRVHPDDAPRLRDRFQEMLKTSGPLPTITYRYIQKDGSVVHLESIGTNLLDDPVIRGVIINTRDVSEHVRIERELGTAVTDLRTSELKYRRLVAHAYDSITVIGADGGVLFESPNVERLLGYTREEAASMNAFDFIHPDELADLTATFAAFATRPGAVMTQINRCRHKDGSWRYLETTSTNLIDDPVIGGIVMNSRDVTGKFLAEQEREELLALVNIERDRLNNVMRAIPGMIWESRNAPGSMEQETVFVNDYVEKLYGYTVDEWVGTANFWLQTIHPEEVAKMRHHAHDFSSQNEIHMVHRAVRKDGRPIWVDVRLIITRDDTGSPAGTIGFAFDVTDQIRAERALRRSERRYRSLVTATAQIVWGTDADGIGRPESLQWGDPAESDAAPVRTDTTRASWLESVHPDDLPEVVSAWQESLMHRRRYEGEHRLRTEDGSYRLVHARAVPVLDDDGRVLEWIGTCTDITDQKLAEEALRRSEEYFRLITENSLDLVSILDTDGRVRYVSPSYERALGWEPGERIGGDTFSVIHPEDAPMIARRMREILRMPGNTTKAELRLRHKDGSWKVFESFAKNLTGEPAVDGIIVSSRDITERKQAEQELQEAHDRLEARVAERTAEIVKMMERLEESYANQKRFVADASHDLRTPLTALRAELDLILQREEIEDGLRGALVRITNQARRLDQLTNDLLVLATLDSNQKLNQVEYVRIDDLVIESISNLSAFAAEKNVSWNIQFDDAIEVTCDMTAIRRALFNVLENATKYSHTETVIDVTLRQTGDTAIVEVTDHGVGVPEEDLPRVFERFYRGDRTRSTHGTGLGLAIVKAVIEAHGGSVTMTSSADAGTTVHMELPRGTSGSAAA